MRDGRFLNQNWFQILPFPLLHSTHSMTRMSLKIIKENSNHANENWQHLWIGNSQKKKLKHLIFKFISDFLLLPDSFDNSLSSLPIPVSLLIPLVYGILLSLKALKQRGSETFVTSFSPPSQVFSSLPLGSPLNPDSYFPLWPWRWPSWQARSFICFHTPPFTSYVGTGILLFWALIFSSVIWDNYAYFSLSLRNWQK